MIFVRTRDILLAAAGLLLGIGLGLAAVFALMLVWR